MSWALAIGDGLVLVRLVFGCGRRFERWMFKVTFDDRYSDA